MVPCVLYFHLKTRQDLRDLAEPFPSAIALPCFKEQSCDSNGTALNFHTIEQFVYLQSQVLLSNFSILMCCHSGKK